jgi:hypothetical protein
LLEIRSIAIAYIEPKYVCESFNVPKNKLPRPGGSAVAEGMSGKSDVPVKQQLIFSLGTLQTHFIPCNAALIQHLETPSQL